MTTKNNASEIELLHSNSIAYLLLWSAKFKIIYLWNTPGATEKDFFKYMKVIQNFLWEYEKQVRHLYFVTKNKNGSEKNENGSLPM